MLDSFSGFHAVAAHGQPTGHRSPGARPIQAADSIEGVRDGPTPVTHPPVYIERALINPDGDEPGNEAVVIGNTTVAVVDLTGWSIVDKNNKADVLQRVLLPAGESSRVVLSGTGAQLGNRGGTISLKNLQAMKSCLSATRRRMPPKKTAYSVFNT